MIFIDIIGMEWYAFMIDLQIIYKVFNAQNIISTFKSKRLAS